MNLSVIAFGVMTGFAILFVAAIFVMERSFKRPEFPKYDIAEIEDDNPFENVDWIDLDKTATTQPMRGVQPYHDNPRGV